jgi:hypothetical protein
MEELKGVENIEIPYESRFEKAFFIFVISAISCTLWIYFLFIKGDSQSNFWIPSLLFVIGCLFAWRALHTTSKKVYEKHFIDSKDLLGRPTKKEVLTPDAIAAKTKIEEAENWPYNATPAIGESNSFDDFLESIWGRLLMASLFAGAAYWLYSDNPDKLILPSLFAFAAFCCVFDLFLWIIGASLIIALLVGIGGAISSLSIPVTIIIGAIIISFALKS